MKQRIAETVFEEMARDSFDGMTVAESARNVRARYGLEQAQITIERDYHRWKARADKSVELPDWNRSLPEILTIQYRDFAFLADGHGPYFHTLNLSTFLAWAKAERLNTLVIGGDWIDHDWISKWPSAYGSGNKPEVDAQIEHIYHILAALADRFTEIYWLPGNHDMRPLKALIMRLGFDHWTKMFLHAKEPSVSGPYIVSAVPLMRVTGGPTGDWLLCHQQTYSRIPGRTASRIAAKYDCNVITTHEHVAATCPSDGSGAWQAVAAPCACDPRKIEYKALSVTTHPNWTVGWAAVRGGVGHVFRYERMRSFWKGV